MNEKNSIAMEPVTQTGNNWDTFLQTGNIEAYLLYKYTSGFYDKEDKDDKWRKSEPRELS